MKYQTRNGWTKESMLAHVKAEFKGKSTKGRNSEVCLYRGPNGKKCAVGMFIPDEKYSPSMENKSALGLSNDHEYVDTTLPLSFHGMDSLQSVHDGSHPDSTLKQMLQWIEVNVE